MNTIELMKKLLAISDVVRKMPVSALRQEVLEKISVLVPELVDISTAPETNTGLPCPYCKQNLPRIHVRRTDDAVIKSFDVCLSLPAQSSAEIRSMCRFLLDMYK